ncbi:MAG: hypothetical protein D4R68_05205 [Ignavibacteriales bacterium]|nr:MAG: hypothetical protein D4R68_05205 [Ignavibacteriales bacterium]
MDIIPIIYTVLIIVVVLTIFTLTFSFYSERKKQRGADENPKSVPVHEIPPPKSVLERNNSFLNKSENLQPISILSPQKTIQVKGGKKVNPSDKIGLELKKTKNDKILKDNKKKLIRNGRLEVLNSISGNDVNKNVKSEMSGEQNPNLKSLGSNILDNYSDEEKNDMFTLKVKDQKDKPKNKT